jgi:hypothetical protein
MLFKAIRISFSDFISFGLKLDVFACAQTPMEKRQKDGIISSFSKFFELKVVLAN